MKKFTGKCLCGAIAYEINGELGTIVNCHCSKCRRWHGSAFRTRAAVESKKFHWRRGEEHLSKYHSSENVIKTFCSIPEDRGQKTEDRLRPMLMRQDLYQRRVKCLGSNFA